VGTTATRPPRAFFRNRMPPHAHRHGQLPCTSSQRTTPTPCSSSQACLCALRSSPSALPSASASRAFPRVRIVAGALPTWRGLHPHGSTAHHTASPFRRRAARAAALDRGRAPRPAHRAPARRGSTASIATFPRRGSGATTGTSRGPTMMRPFVTMPPELMPFMA
jgi:hypothetical protein